MCIRDSLYRLQQRFRCRAPSAGVMAGGNGRAKGEVQRVAVGQRRGALLRDGVGAGVQTARALPLLPGAILCFQGDELPVEPYARRALRRGGGVLLPGGEVAANPGVDHALLRFGEDRRSRGRVSSGWPGLAGVHARGGKLSPKTIREHHALISSIPVSYTHLDVYKRQDI